MPRLTDEQLRNLRDNNLLTALCNEILAHRAAEAEAEADFEARQEEEDSESRTLEMYRTLVRNAVCNARPRDPGQHSRQSAVSQALAVGSTTARELCVHFKKDPDEKLEGPVCEYCATTDNSAYHTLAKIGLALHLNPAGSIEGWGEIQRAMMDYTEDQADPPDRSLSVTRNGRSASSKCPSSISWN